ncbi:DUF3300 domain-containing protein [Allomuricauda sp. SCSIO 65647]|uniref:DUF3300 domain-containing protein n=1 Tax=Allomuricauda sp. SCSIO 65647 TaxID=2908843 RepID=UPI001F362276|nr:DUF3300 domain-containing protein [Muricauda sp. SCSIO 65647]UJH66390.1 DUF3300 domain-containing protein [Muricauda sp. SCSIO 65647]
MTRISNLIAVLFVLQLCSPVFAQENRTILRSLAKQEQEVVDAIVLYPEETRKHIFEVAQHPALLIRLDGLQQTSQEAFLTTVINLDRAVQESFYELTRYPRLIDSLADISNSKYNRGKLIASYPEEIQDDITVVLKEKKALEQIASLNESTRLQFNETIARYPQDAQISIKELVHNPELLSLLVDNIDMTILAGDIYQENPEWITEKAEELNLEAARKQAEELNDYKKQLEEDPEAFQEMQQAANLYAQDNNINENEYKEPTSVKVTYSYSYWYGYPYWYTHPYWTPLPYYYYTGFYYGPRGTVIIIGLPSYHYVHWHYTHYPHRHIHLHAHYHRHYKRHPHSRSGLNVAVRTDRNKNLNRSSNNTERAKPNRSGQGTTKKNSPKLDFQEKAPRDRNYEQFKNNDKLKSNWSNRKNKARNRG